MSAWHILHDVPFNFFIFKYRQTIINKNRWRGRLKIGPETYKTGRYYTFPHKPGSISTRTLVGNYNIPEVWGRLLHVHSRNLETNRLELSQKVEVHEVFLAK